ncbi:hypothetical protein AWENTII_011416 [Aspergillus wentii]|nr:hypothetical protein MW887_003882 [Aspergillus wentii]
MPAKTLTTRLDDGLQLGGLIANGNFDAHQGEEVYRITSSRLDVFELNTALDSPAEDHL